MIDINAMNKDPWPTWPVDKNELGGLVEEIDRLKTALAFYANETNWSDRAVISETSVLQSIPNSVVSDYGSRARAALAERRE
jgi:hypothetical protein